MNHGFSKSREEDQSERSLLEQSASLIRHEASINRPGAVGLSKFGLYPQGPGALPTQASHFEKWPKGYTRSDTRIEDEVCERLAHDRGLDASELDVRVQDGVVTLAGSVRDRAQKYRAEDMIETVPGVREIHNRIRLQRQPPVMKDPRYDWFQHA